MGRKSENPRRRLKGLGSVYFDSTNNKWIGSIDIGTDERGKRMRKKFTGDTQAIVVKKIRDYQQSPEMLATKASEMPIFSDFGNAYIINYKKTKLKPTSYTREYKVFKNNIVPYIGFCKLDSITSDVIQVKLLNTLMNQGYSYSTLHKVYILTNEILRHACRTKLISDNPCQYVIAPNQRMFLKSKKEIRVLSDEEIQRFAEAALSPRRPNGKYVLSIIYTGLRCGEAAALKWKDIDFSTNSITVGRNMEYMYDDVESDDPKRMVIEQDSTKTKSFRKIFMTKSARKYLTELYEERKPNKNDYLVLYKSLPSPDVLLNAYKTIVRSAGIEDPQGIHTLRHTCASLLIRNGVDIKIISEMLGHSSVSFTYDTYIHIIEEHAKSVIEEIDV